MPTFSLYPSASPTSSSSPYSCQRGACRHPSTCPPASGGECIKYQCHRAVPLLPTPPHLYFGPGLPSPHHATAPYARLIPGSEPLSGCSDWLPPPDLLTYGTSFHNDMAVNTTSMRPFNPTSSSSPFGPVFPPPNSSLGGFVSAFSPSSPPISLSSLVPPLPPFTFQDHYPLQCSPSGSTSQEGVSCMAYPFSCSSSLSDGFGSSQDATHQETPLSSPSPAMLSSWVHPVQAQSARLNSSALPSAVPDGGPCTQRLAECNSSVLSMGSSFLHQPYVGPQYPPPLSLPPGSHCTDPIAVPQSADDLRGSGHVWFPSQAAFPDMKHQGGGTFHNGKANFGHLKELHNEEANNNWSLEDRLWIGSEYANSNMSPEELRWERHQKLRGYSKCQGNMQLSESRNLQSYSTGSNVQTGVHLPGQCAAYSEHDVKNGELPVPVSVGHHTPSLKWAASAFAEMLATAGDSSPEQTTPPALDFGGSDVISSSLCSNLGLMSPSVYRVSSFGGLSYYKLNGEADGCNWGQDSSQYGKTYEDQIGASWDDPLVLAPLETYKWPGKTFAGASPSTAIGARPKRIEPSVPKRSKAWYAKDVRKSLSVTGKSICGSKVAKEISTDTGICDNVRVPPELSDGDKGTFPSLPMSAADGKGDDLGLNHWKCKPDSKIMGEDKWPQRNPKISSSSAQSSRGYQNVDDAGGWFRLPEDPHVVATGQDDVILTEEIVFTHAGTTGSSLPSSEELSRTTDVAEADLDSQTMFGRASHGSDVHETSSNLGGEESAAKDGKCNKRVWSSGTGPDVSLVNGPSSFMHGCRRETTRPGIPVVLSEMEDCGETLARSSSDLYEPGLQSMHEVETANTSHTAFPSWLPTINVNSGESSFLGHCNPVDSTAYTASVSSPFKVLETDKSNVSEFPCASNTFSSGGSSTAAINQGVSQEEKIILTPRFSSLTKSLETLTSVLLACLSSSFNSLMATQIDALQNSVHNISECLLFEVSAKCNHRHKGASSEEITLKAHQDLVQVMQAGSSLSSVPPTGTAINPDRKATAVCSESDLPVCMKDHQDPKDGSVHTSQELYNLQDHLQDRIEVPKGEFQGGAGNFTREEVQSTKNRAFAHYDIESLQLELRAKEAEIARLKLQGLKNAVLRVHTSEEKVAEVEKLRRAEVLIENLRDELEVEREENKGAMHLYKVMLHEAKDGAAHALREAERIKLELAALKAKMAQGSQTEIVGSTEVSKIVEARVALIKARQEWVSTGSGGEIPARDDDEFRLCVEYPGFTMGSSAANSSCRVGHVDAKSKLEANRNAEKDERPTVEMRAAVIKARYGSNETDKEIEPLQNADDEGADVSSEDQQGSHSYLSSTILPTTQGLGCREGDEGASKLLESTSGGSVPFTNVTAQESLEIGLSELEEPGWEHILPVQAFEEAAQQKVENFSG